MEKFFIVTEGNELRKDYLGYKTNSKLINYMAKKFCNMQLIMAEEYCAYTEQFYIVPTEEDFIKFDKVLCKEVNDGLRPFKITSKVNKAWIKLLKNEGLIVTNKPYVSFYFDSCCGKHNTRIFDVEGIVYLSMSMDYDFETPKGMIEIKASEFYKVVEDNS